MLWQIKSPSPICHTIRHTCKFLFINKFKLAVTDVTDFCRKTSLLLPTKKSSCSFPKRPLSFLKSSWSFEKRPCLLRWNSGSFGHDFTYVRIHSPVRMCGSLRDVRKKACFLVRDKTQCAQIYCKNDVADYKKEIHGYKKWELFSILFIIPYLCRVFHADTSVREVWESGKYIYIEKTFTWRFVLGTLKLRKFLTLPQTKQQ